jgi:hypothetical protein
MRPARVHILALAAICAAPAAASAQVPTPTAPVPPPAPVPAPPKAGKVSIKVSGGQATRKLRYVARGGFVRVEGRVRPFVAGQVATLEVLRSGKVVSRQRAAIRRGGKVRFRFRTRRRGVLRLRVRHAATAAQKAFRSRSVRLKAVVLRAGQGAHGTHVLILQRALKDLGYAVPVTGHYDGGTSRAVLAFRKTNNFARTGYASPRIYSLALQGRGGFKLRFPGAGRHVEFDWSRQVLVLADRGKARRVYHSSSGAPVTPTVFGTFRFYRKSYGTNAKGMVHSSYFIGGYAIHGYHSVPAFPASHGCLRVPIPNALDIFKQISLGETIFVYR